MVITIAAYIMMAIFMYVIMKKKNVTIYSFSINSISFRNYFSCSGQVKTLTSVH